VVAGLEEVLALEIFGANRVHGGPRGTEFTLGEKLRGREGSLLVGLLRCRGTRLHARNRDGIAANTVRGAHVRALLGQRARGAEATEFLGLIEESRLGSRIGCKKNVERDYTGEHEAEPNHLRL
jgi:hypothetical protein